MNQQEKFQPFLEGKVASVYQSSLRRKKVIKQKSVKVHDPVKIKIDESEFEENQREKIQPIIEKNNVVGVIYTCSCGKSTEVRFEYEPVNANNSKINS